MSERQIPEMTADELRAISRKLTNYVDLRPSESDARSLAIRCGEIAALLEAQSPGSTVIRPITALRL